MKGGGSFRKTEFGGVAYKNPEVYICGYTMANTDWFVFSNATQTARPFIISYNWNVAVLNYVKWYSSTAVSPQSASFEKCKLSYNEQRIIVMGKTYITSNYDSGYDGLHIITASTGAHIKSWYHSNTAAGALSLNIASGTAEMLDDKIFWIRNSGDGSVFLTTIDNTGSSP